MAMIRQRYNRGMAVIMALSAVLLMVTAALELHLNERANMIGSAVYRDRLTLDQMARSAVELAMAVLIRDRLDSQTDSLQEDWADQEILAGLLAEMSFDQGTVEVQILDEMGKIQINSLIQFPEGRQFNETQRQLWERFAQGLLSIDKDEPEAEDQPETDPLTIINSLKDWLDSGDDDAITGLSGAESDYYEALDPPYACKNGPFDDLSELRLVQGITPELFDGAGGAAGLEDYLTTYGESQTNDNKFTFPGKININTAALPVLAALLPAESAEFAQLIVEYRQATSGELFTHDLTQSDWYKNVPGLAGTSIDSELITLSSTIFRVVVTATLNNIHLTTTVIIERLKPSDSGPWQCKVLNWKTQ